MTEEQGITEVVVVGSTMIDLVTYVDTLPKVGETVFGNSFVTSFGGKGANQAVQCAKLGVGVSMVGKLGADTYGNQYMDQFLAEGVDISCMRQSSSSGTGTASIQVDGHGQNSIIIVTGANQEIAPTDIVGEVDRLIARAKIVICQNEINAAATAAALQACKHHGTISILNPAPADGAEVQSLVGLCDIVCPNEVELSVLTGMPTSSDEEVELAAESLLNCGCKMVVVTLGSRGAYFRPSSSLIAKENSPKAAFFSADKTNAIDTVGAGDSFIGSFAANLARGSTIEESIRRAIFCASISVTRKGAQISYTSSQELNELNPDMAVPPISSAQATFAASAEDGSAVLRIMKEKLNERLFL